MKTIGLLGGMSWESTELYYRRINEIVRQRLGGLHSAKMLIHSVDFADIEAMQRSGAWQQAGECLAHAALGLQGAGADFILIGTNTMHKVAEQVSSIISIPLLHLADATAQVIQQHDMDHVGLLGTGYTMEQDFYIERIRAAGIQVTVPNKAHRDVINRVIFEELCMGIVKDASREQYIRAIDSMREAGIQGVIEGCTEITLLVKPEHTGIPLFDTTLIHAQVAVDYALLS